METAKLSILFFMTPGAQGLCLQQAVSVTGAGGSTVSSFKESPKTHLTRCVLCPARPSFPNPFCEAVFLTCHLTAPPTQPSKPSMFASRVVCCPFSFLSFRLCTLGPVDLLCPGSWKAFPNVVPRTAYFPLSFPRHGRHLLLVLSTGSS